MANQAEQIGRAFIQHYYTVFDKDRSQLLPLYVSATSKRRTNNLGGGEATRHAHRQSEQHECRTIRRAAV